MSKSVVSLAILFLPLSVFGQSPQKINDLMERGLRAHKNGNYTAAIADYSEVIELTSMPAATRKQKYREIAETLDEKTQRERIRLIDPRTAAAYVNRGNLYFLLGRSDEALDDYENALRVSPGLAEAYVCRGGILIFRREYERAINDYRHAIKLAPNLTKAHVGLAIALLENGETKNAFAEFDAAVVLAPHSGEVFYRRGDGKRKVGDLGGASVDYEIAMKLDPSDPGVHLGRGQLRYLEHDFDGAIKDLTRAIELSPYISESFTIRGYALTYLGRDAEAEIDFKRAIEILPGLKTEIEAGARRIKSIQK